MKKLFLEGYSKNAIADAFTGNCNSENQKSRGGHEWNVEI